MGSFFTSVQVRPADLSPDDARIRIAEAVRGWMAERGYAPAGDDEPPDREVVIPTGGPWISVYDSATEEQDERVLQELALRCAGATGGLAVGILVHDSDVLLLSLADRGQVLDRYNNCPHYFDRIPADQAERLAGQPALWADLGADPDTLAALWTRGAGEAEAILYEMSPWVGWDRERVLSGFRYREDQEDDLRLGFRLAQRPLHERRHTGPPNFIQGGRPEVLEGAQDDTLTLHCSYQSTGGAGRGLALVAWGPAVESGLVELERAAVTWGKPLQRLEATFDPRRRGLMARFPDAPIPAGVPMEAVMRAPSGAQRAAMDALFSAQLGLQVQGRFRAGGRGALHLGLFPATHQDGNAIHSVGIRVLPTTRKPLRWCGRGEADESLRAMATPETLFAWVSLPAESQAVAAEAMADWHGLIGDLYTEPWRVSRYLGNGRLKSGTLTPKAIPRWKSWKSLIAVLETGRGFTASRATGPWLEDQDPVLTNDGFSCVRAFPWRGVQQPGDAPATSLGLWVDLSSRPAGLGDQLEPALIALVDRVMASSGAAQAVVGRWRWQPQADVESTPYEWACGVRGQCTTTHRWADRWLRGVTPTLWLGPALLERVALPSCVDVTAHGDARRLALRAGHTLDTLERELGPILPGEADWKAAMGWG